jgi:hypothetical protein
MYKYECKAIIMEGPNTGTRCGDDCANFVDKKNKSKRFNRPGHTDVFPRRRHTRRYQTAVEAEVVL